MTVVETEQLVVDVELERECVQFLYREAELLDERKYREWLETCLSESLEYLVPVRTARESTSGASEFSSTSFHVSDTYSHVKVRIDRLEGEHAWAEDPPSRTRRFVTNIRVRNLPNDEIEVRSNLLLYRSQMVSPSDHVLLVGERQDVLRSEAGGLRLRRRVVLLDQTTLSTANLGVFL
jgi:3-phenylpropionate/cinnamic acid dioxygenase small subunit